MILVLDAGNSTIDIGVYQNDLLLHHWRMETNLHKTEDEYAMTVKTFFLHVERKFEDVEGVIISSVVPSIMYSLQEMCRKYFKINPLIVGPGVKTGLNIKYENPRQVGSDRIVNAVAALAEYGGRPIVIVDFGTAITYCYIDEKGNYIGGAITPGITISLEALFNEASKLPRIELLKPSNVIGKNTVAAMQSGIFYGFIGQVEGIVRRIIEQSNEEPIVIATGGLSKLFGYEAKIVDIVDPLLTLKGLYILYKRNQ
ncbi:type III pantothenate kinase [Ureibacillus manganicus]|uniref:Type III pantothenate kinase n=1 Tax=Ureibacillus manganicus DSM 26584 TaxID=1384049 RepID=A0A0A3HVE2_9BACL|nr:type III pantothenate kinase [Ureibacillus manganicus]KGR76586.1 pantothenate kinase [Ureibacillus manganicus DSM 26584]